MHTDDNGAEYSGQLDAARRLGREHGRAGTTPFGGPGHAYPESSQTGTPSYTDYVYWDAGSANLMDALGETGETTEENHATRAALVAAYCDTYDQARAIALRGAPRKSARRMQSADKPARGGRYYVAECTTDRWSCQHRHESLTPAAWCGWVKYGPDRYAADVTLGAGATPAWRVRHYAPDGTRLPLSQADYDEMLAAFISWDQTIPDEN